MAGGKRRRAPWDDRGAHPSSVEDEVEKAPSPRPSTTRTVPPGRKRKGFLENSQLSEKDRRHVRYKERELLQSLKSHAHDLAKLGSHTFDAHTQELDQMYDRVCYPREANLDASNLDELNVAIAKQSYALGASDLTKFDATEFIRATQNACTLELNGALDWHALGNAAGACFRSVPESCFLFGLMDTEVVQKEKKKARRVEKDVNAQEAQPTEYTNKRDRKDAQARRLEILQTKLIEGDGVKPLLDLVLNPKSFTQTVENLFDTSFLVRNNSAEIGIDERSGLPYLKNQEGLGDVHLPASTQSIISITPTQWEQLARVTGRAEPLLGHRS